MYYKITVLLLFFVLSADAAFAYEATVRLTHIQDGDTFKALVYEEETKIRLLDVDCYETEKNARTHFQQEYYGLPYDEIVKRGRESKQKLQDLIGQNKELFVKWNKRDGFGRILGEVYSGNINVNKYMLQERGCEKHTPANKMKKIKNQ